MIYGKNSILYRLMYILYTLVYNIQYTVHTMDKEKINGPLLILLV